MIPLIKRNFFALVLALSAATNISQAKTECQLAPACGKVYFDEQTGWTYNDDCILGPRRMRHQIEALGNEFSEKWKCNEQSRSKIQLHSSSLHEIVNEIQVVTIHA